MYEKNFSVYRVLILIFRCVLNPEEGGELMKIFKRRNVLLDNSLIG